MNSKETIPLSHSVSVEEIVVLVPRLTPGERPSSLLRSVLFRAVARFARTSCVVLLSVTIGAKR